MTKGKKLNANRKRGGEEGKKEKEEKRMKRKDGWDEK